jgi:class 3 adenylate cyclase
MGSLMAGIVGKERYQFDIWGDTVNVAARLTGASSPSAVALTEGMAALLPDATVLSRGEVELKGKGLVRIAEVTAMTQNAPA